MKNCIVKMISSCVLFSSVFFYSFSNSYVESMYVSHFFPIEKEEDLFKDVRKSVWMGDYMVGIEKTERDTQQLFIFHLSSRKKSILLETTFANTYLKVLGKQVLVFINKQLFVIDPSNFSGELNPIIKGSFDNISDIKLKFDSKGLAWVSQQGDKWSLFLIDLSKENPLKIDDREFDYIQYIHIGSDGKGLASVWQGGKWSLFFIDLSQEDPLKLDARKFDEIDTPFIGSDGKGLAKVSQGDQEFFIFIDLSQKDPLKLDDRVFSQINTPLIGSNGKGIAKIKQGDTWSFIFIDLSQKDPLRIDARKFDDIGDDIHIGSNGKGIAWVMQGDKYSFIFIDLSQENPLNLDDREFDYIQYIHIGSDGKGLASVWQGGKLSLFFIDLSKEDPLKLDDRVFSQINTPLIGSDGKGVAKIKQGDTWSFIFIDLSKEDPLKIDDREFDQIPYVLIISDGKGVAKIKQGDKWSLFLIDLSKEDPLKIDDREFDQINTREFDQIDTSIGSDSKGIVWVMQGGKWSFIFIDLSLDPPVYMMKESNYCSFMKDLPIHRIGKHFYIFDKGEAYKLRSVLSDDNKQVIFYDKGVEVRELCIEGRWLSTSISQIGDKISQPLEGLSDLLSEGVVNRLGKQGERAVVQGPVPMEGHYWVDGQSFSLEDCSFNDVNKEDVLVGCYREKDVLVDSYIYVPVVSFLEKSDLVKSFTLSSSKKVNVKIESDHNYVNFVDVYDEGHSIKLTKGQEISMGIKESISYLSILTKDVFFYKTFIKLSKGEYKSGTAYCISGDGSMIGGQLKKTEETLDVGCVWIRDEKGNYNLQIIKSMCLVQGVNVDGKVIVGVDLEGYFCMAERCEEDYVLVKQEGLDFPLLYGSVLECSGMFPSCSFVSIDGLYAACLNSNKLHVWCKNDGSWLSCDINSSLDLQGSKIKDCVGFDDSKGLLVNLEMGGEDSGLILKEDLESISSKEYKLNLDISLLNFNRDSKKRKRDSEEDSDDESSNKRHKIE